MAVKVFNPRGNRGDGGGLLIQVSMTEETVQEWLGQYGQPSAIERSRIERALQREMDAAWKAAKAWLADKEVQRDEQERGRRAVEAEAARQEPVDQAVGGA